MNYKRAVLAAGVGTLEGGLLSGYLFYIAYIGRNLGPLWNPGDPLGASADEPFESGKLFLLLVVFPALVLVGSALTAMVLGASRKRAVLTSVLVYAATALVMLPLFVGSQAFLPFVLTFALPATLVTWLTAYMKSYLRISGVMTLGSVVITVVFVSLLLAAAPLAGDPTVIPLIGWLSWIVLPTVAALFYPTTSTG